MNLEILATVMRVLPWLGIAGMIFALLTYFDIKRKPPGSELMQKIAGQIHHGAFVFIKREYQIISLFIVVLFIVLTYTLSIQTALAFLAGAICSMFAGILGMEAATRSSVRACQGAKTGGIASALSIAFRG